MRKSIPQILVADGAGRLNYALPVALQKAGMLAKFCTGTYMGRGSSWYWVGKLARLIPTTHRPQALKRMLIRQTPELPPEKIMAFNPYGIKNWLALRRCRTMADLEAAWLALGNEFSELVGRTLPTFKLDAVLTFAMPCLPLFQAASKLGLKKIMEKGNAILVARKLVHEEHQLWPGWEPPFPDPQVWQSRIDQEEKEIESADLLICPADYGKNNLMGLGVPEEKIAVVPFGINVSAYDCERQEYKRDRPLRILFAGNVNLNKGIQYLYEALTMLSSPQISVRAVGSINIKEPYRTRLSERMEMTGFVPANEMREHYRWADLFVFPSITEGSAAVVYEALASGLPVVTTPNAGSVVRDGLEGFIVPIRDATALAERINQLSNDPELLGKMAIQARQRAADFTWDKYGERLAEAVSNIFN